jgi:transposase
VRKKFTCRDCETITQPPAPFHVTRRGFAGPNLLAMILFEKFGQHQPLGYRTPMAVWRERMHAAEAVDMVDNADALTTCPQQQQQTESLAA